MARLNQQHPALVELLQRIATEQLPPAVNAGGVLSDAEFFDLFESQLSSRLLDLQSRLMQAAGQSFYTIGSAGHEGNAAIAKALRVTDPAFLHYRSGAFFLQRAKQLPGSTPIYDMLLSFSASSDDPIAGGRHKVLGSLALNIPPQTSTIASHLPKAMGTAFAIGLSKRLNHRGTWPADAIAMCSFGDASANHSTAVGAMNAASWTAYQTIPMPLLMVCEDNGLGISTHTPSGWIQQQLSQRPALKYFQADGSNLAETYLVAREAADYVRSKRKPAILHLRTVRLYGHAGADAEVSYRSKQEIARDAERDPLLHGAAALIQRGLFSAAELVTYITEQQQRIARIAAVAAQRPKLETAAAVMASIAPAYLPAPQAPALAWPTDKPQHLAKMINFALQEAMSQHQHIVMCGEDIAKKGGVYGVTQQLFEKFGPNRVLNTLLDEQSILGLAIGMAQQGFLPIPEIQFLAYVHNAEDQIRGEAATLSFFSNGQYRNPMVIRIAGLAYQRGFGGHFHNDNSFAVFRDIPGVILLCPSNGVEGVQLVRDAVRLAHEQQRVVILLEPIALYMTRDLHQEGDNGWLFSAEGAQGVGSYAPAAYLPGPQAYLPAPYVYGRGEQLAIVTYGNGYYLSRQAEKVLAEQGYQLRVIDLRCLIPLQTEAVIAALGNCRNVLIVDECRRRGSLSEELFTVLHEAKPGHYAIQRLTAEDSFIPLGKAAYITLPSRDQIVAKATDMLGGLSA